MELTTAATYLVPRVVVCRWMRCSQDDVVSGAVVADLWHKEWRHVSRIVANCVLPDSRTI